MRWRSGSYLGIALALICAVAAGGATIVVNPGDDIQTAINGAAAGDTIQLAAGVHNVAATVNVNKALIVEGVGGAVVQGTTSAARNVFKITASNVTVQDLNITLSTAYALGGELEDCLIGVPDNAALTGVVIRGNSLYWPAQAGAMSTWGGRAITIGSNGAPNIVIADNAVYNTRNGIVVRYNNPAIITDNLVYNTKGGVMNYTNNQADADTRILAGNNWGTAHNEWDIVWNSGGSFFTPDYHATVLLVSEANNGAYVVDRRDAANWNYATGNRSHIFMNPTGKTAPHEAQGTMNEPFATFALAVEGVVADGAVYVDIGSYQEQVVIGKNLDVLGSGLATIIESPDTLSQYFTTGSNKNYPIVYVHDADDVAIRDLVVDGLGKGNANYRFIGIAFFNAGGTVENVEIRGIRDTPFSGAQHGVALYAYNDDGTPRELNVIGNLIYDFQKNAMALSGDGLTVNVLGSTIIGAGPTGVTAQNGIQVGWGATGTIQGNTVSGIWYTGSGWAASGILVASAAPGVEVSGNTVSGAQYGIYMESANGLVAGNSVDGSSYALLLYDNDIATTGNDLLNSYVGAYLRAGKALGAFERNVIVGNTYGAYLAGTVGVPVRYNAFSGNTYGFWPAVGQVDAALNWWGSTRGPSVATNPGGDGDAIYGDVIYSPWLGADPDGQLLLPGVQITAPMYIVVAPVGPEPTGGYLNMAITGSNMVPGVGAHTVGVREGTYDASQPITNPVNLFNEGGTAANTILNGAISIGAGDVLIGGLRHGFTINGPVTVGAGIDASTIHINWNDLYDVVTNHGLGWLDATFNYWGEDGPETVGLVDTYPFLPDPVETILGYMDAHGLTALEAIDLALLMGVFGDIGDSLTALALMQTYGMSGEEAAALIDEYGAATVAWALLRAFSYEDFVLSLLGYGAEIPAGGAGGGTEDGGPSTYVVGELVPFYLVLTHPVTGAAVENALVTYTVAQLQADGTYRFVAFGVMPYDAAAGGYARSLDTTGWEPGSYEVYLGSSDGRSLHYTIEIVAAE